MSVVVGVDLGRELLRVAALIDDHAELVLTVPAQLAWSGDAVVVGEAARARPAGERLGRLPDWLDGGSGDGVAPGPLGIGWPVVAGEPRAPAEAVAWLLRAALVAVEERHGPVLGAVLAVEPSLGVVGRRALRDAAVIAGLPAVRLMSAPVCAALMAPGAPDGIWAVVDAGSGALTVSVLERFGGAVHPLAHAREPGLGGAALVSALAGLHEGGARIDRVCQDALAVAGCAATELIEVLLVGGSARLTGVQGRLHHQLARPPYVLAEPVATAALGAAAAARMFLAEPAALCVDALGAALALAVDGEQEAVLAAGAVAPARGLRVIATTTADVDRLEVELWEQGARPRPISRHALSGLPATAAGDAVAICEVAVDADLLPTLAARELVTGAALAVTTLAEAAVEPDRLAVLRSRVAGWRP